MGKDIYVDAEVTMMMTVFGAKGKLVTQLPETSEKEYEGVPREGERMQK